MQIFLNALMFVVSYGSLASLFISFIAVCGLAAFQALRAVRKLTMRQHAEPLTVSKPTQWKSASFS